MIDVHANTVYLNFGTVLWLWRRWATVHSRQYATQSGYLKTLYWSEGVSQRKFSFIVAAHPKSCWYRVCCPAFLVEYTLLKLLSISIHLVVKFPSYCLPGYFPLPTWQPQLKSARARRGPQEGNLIYPSLKPIDRLVVLRCHEDFTTLPLSPQ